jgi:O-antigen/teichoic acid export membrane protein
MAHGVLFALSLLTSVLVARLLGPDGKGAYALVLLFASIFVFFSSLGLHHAAAFFLGRKDFPPAEVLGHTLLSLAAVTTLAVAAAALVGPLLAGTLFPGVAPGLLAWGMPLIVGQLAFGYLAQILLGRNEIGGYNLVQILRGALLLLVAGPVLLAGYGVAGILGGESLSFLAGAGLAFVLVRRQIRTIAIRINPHYLRASLRYGLTVHAGHALSFFHYRTALLLLSALSTPAAVGLYSVAAGVAGNLSLLSHGAATALFPRISSDPDATQTRELTPLVLRTTLLVTGTAGAILALVGPWLIVMVFGRPFAGSARALQVLLPGAIALCAWSILDSYFKGAGRPLWSTLTTGLAVAVGGALSLWWIPTYGVLGASAASSLGYVASLLMALAAYSRLSGIGLPAVLLPRRADLALYASVLSRISRLPVGGKPAPPDARGERWR